MMDILRGRGKGSAKYLREDLEAFGRILREGAKILSLPYSY